MIVDTNILIDYLRDKAEAIHFVEVSHPAFSISVISVTELYAGLKGGNELFELQEFLTTFPIHEVSEEIASLAGSFLNRYAKSHAIGIADALIAATASVFNEELATLNTKDFPMVAALLKPY
jgi:predicted nucleic acid-binding protein